MDIVFSSIFSWYRLNLHLYFSLLDSGSVLCLLSPYKTKILPYIDLANHHPRTLSATVDEAAISDHARFDVDR